MAASYTSRRRLCEAGTSGDSCGPTSSTSSSSCSSMPAAYRSSVRGRGGASQANAALCLPWWPFLANSSGCVGDSSASGATSTASVHRVASRASRRSANRPRSMRKRSAEAAWKLGSRSGRHSRSSPDGDPSFSSSAKLHASRGTFEPSPATSSVSRVGTDAGDDVDASSPRLARTPFSLATSTPSSSRCFSGTSGATTLVTLRVKASLLARFRAASAAALSASSRARLASAADASFRCGAAFFLGMAARPCDLRL